MINKGREIENLFLSVGAMKAGTTWVYDKLQYHPQIHFSQEKEIYYFSHVNGVASSLSKDKLKRRARQALLSAAKKFKSGDMVISEYRAKVDWYLNYVVDEVSDDWYLNLFDSAKITNKNTYCSDFSNLNCFLDEEGWRHVRGLAKKIKVIYILRDPVARLWSHYKFHLQFIGHGEQEAPDLNINLFKRIISKPWFIRNSMYSANIESMKRYLSADEFKVFYLDDISSDSAMFFNQVHKFLGVESYDYSHLDIHEKKNTSISKKIPDEWLDVINSALKEEVRMLRESGYWHSEWRG